ncbi:MAG: AAA family ATPase [Gammaproteobacteria bacterium]|nr:AAA family ATPase [Gammaproteobacteria bacterium]
MYHEHFGLHSPPFKITPDPRMFFTGGKRGLVLDALVYAIASGEGIIKVVGEVGSGKTMLCRMLAEKVPKNVEIVYLANPRLTPDTILQALAIEMHLPIADDPAQMENHLYVMQSLHASLLKKHAENRQVLVLIEEAQGMPLETLEEIRLLSNLETTRHKLLQITLFGQPELDENLSAPHIRQLKERITHNFTLPPLHGQEMAEYIDFRMRAAGYRGPSVFSRAALKILDRTSQGLLRRINILADKSLLAAFSENTHLTEAKHARLAAKDSGFPLSGTVSARFYASTSLAALIFLAGAGVFYWENISAWFMELSATPARPASKFLEDGIPVSDSRSVQTAPVVNESPKAPIQPAASAPPLEDDAGMPVSDPRPPPLADAPLKAPAPVKTTLQQRIEATRQWLQHADGRRYSIQVMLIGEAKSDRLERLLRKPELQPLLPLLYIYPTLIKKQKTWAVVYAEFPNYTTAKSAITALPEILQRYQPFPRTIHSARKKTFLDISRQ